MGSVGKQRGGEKDDTETGDIRSKRFVNSDSISEPIITSGQRSISVQTTERTAQMITRPVIMTGQVNTLRSID